MTASFLSSIPLPAWPVGLIPKILLTKEPAGLSAFLAAEGEVKRADVVGLDQTLRGLQTLLSGGLELEAGRKTPGIQETRFWLLRFFPPDAPPNRKTVDAVQNEVRVDGEGDFIVRKRSMGEIRDRVILPLAFRLRDIPEGVFEAIQEKLVRANRLETLPSSRREELFLDHLLFHSPSHFLLTPLLWRWAWSFRPGGHYAERAELYRSYGDWQSLGGKRREAARSYGREGDLWMRAAGDYLDVETLMDKIPHARAEEVEPVLEGAAFLFGYAREAFRRASFPHRVNALDAILKKMEESKGNYEKQVALFPDLIRFVKRTRRPG